jgi:hypothetical protein
MAMTNCGVMRESGLSILLIPEPICPKKAEKLLAPSKVPTSKKGTTKIKYKISMFFQCPLRN